MRTSLIFGILLLVSLAPLPALPAQQLYRADPAAAWDQIIALDAGPKAITKSTEQSNTATLQHLERQEKELRSFLASYPTDSHSFGAHLRLAHLLAVRSELKGNDKDWMESMKVLDSLAANSPTEKKVDVAFARISLTMRRLKPGDNQASEDLLSKARAFQQSYPQDRRIAPMLAEIATLYDEQPARKESLLNEARRVATDPGTQKRIDDDIKRIALLDKPLELEFTSIQNKPVNLNEYRGKVVLVVFFAEWSAPSMRAVEGVQMALKNTPQAQALGISLDREQDKLSALLKGRNVDWPVYFDGQGWNSPLVRGFGINSLPTVWLVDRSGILRRLNVRGNWEESVRKALRQQ